MCYCERQRYTFPRQIYTLIQSAHTTKKSTEECSKKIWAESHPLCPLPVQHIHTTHLVWHTDCTKKGVFPLLLRLFVCESAWVGEWFWLSDCVFCDLFTLRRDMNRKADISKSECKAETMRYHKTMIWVVRHEGDDKCALNFELLSHLLCIMIS